MVSISRKQTVGIHKMKESSLLRENLKTIRILFPVKISAQYGR